MTLPASLVPTLDALLSRGARWLPLSGSKTRIEQREGDRYLRAAYQAWFDIIFVHEGKPRLEDTNDAAALYAAQPALFAPAVDHGLLEPIPLRGELLERANFVDSRFPELWAGLELGTIDAQCSSYKEYPVLRTGDGSYWEVDELGGAVVFASLMRPLLFAWQLRALLWEGKSPRTRPLSATLRARVEEAVSRDTILRARNVEVQLATPTIPSASYRLQGPDAFRYEDTGKEGLSGDWTNTWPEPIFDFLPYPRAEVEQTLRAQSTTVIGVDYRLGVRWPLSE